MGPAIVALISGLTGRDSIGVLSVSVLFLIGGGLLIGFRSHFTAEAAERSKQAAKNAPDKHQVEKVKRPRSAAALLAVSFCPQMVFYPAG